MAKKSKWVIVATEGATTDDRTIQRNWIEEIAESYDPKNTYGARINLDHIKFSLYMPELANSHCFGDVLAVKAEEREDGKLQLLAELQPTDALIALNKEGQKVYTSVEIDNIFTAAIETELEFVEETQSIFEKIKGLFAKKEKSDDERFTDQTQAIELLAEQTKETLEKLTALSSDLAKQQAEIEEMKAGNAEIQATCAERTKPVEPENPRPLGYGEQPETDGRFF